MNPTVAPRLAVAADAAGIAHVHVTAWRSTYPGMLPDWYLDGMDVADYEDRWARTIHDPFRRSTVFVAEEEGVIVGYASCGHERDGDHRYDGELYAIYVLGDAQGRGHGRALVEAAAAALAIRHMMSMVVWVLRDNVRARGFYERLGGRYLRERPLDLGPGLSAPEVAYIWRDTLPLRRRAPR